MYQIITKSKVRYWFITRKHRLKKVWYRFCWFVKTIELLMNEMRVFLKMFSVVCTLLFLNFNPVVWTRWYVWNFFFFFFFFKSNFQDFQDLFFRILFYKKLKYCSKFIDWFSRKIKIKNQKNYFLKFIDWISKKLKFNKSK